MPFAKGISGNVNGRPIGSGNKDKVELRQYINNFLEKNFKQVTKDFYNLEPKDRIRLYIDLLQYGLPKLQAINLETGFERLPDDQLDEIINRLRNGDIENKERENSIP